MKKVSISLFFAFFVPFLMANSPVAIYPGLYSDYALIEESLQIIEEDLSKYIVIRGEIQNEGEGIIGLQNSCLNYTYENSEFSIYLGEMDAANHVKAILPAHSFAFEQYFEYEGESPIGDITYSYRTIEIFGYRSEEVMSDIIYSNHRISNLRYVEETDTTMGELIFDWVNQADYSSRTFFASYKVGEDYYVNEIYEYIHKDDGGSVNEYIRFAGDIRAEEISELQLFFVREQSYDSSQGWLMRLFIIALLLGVPLLFILLIPIILTIIGLIKYRKNIKPID